MDTARVAEPPGQYSVTNRSMLGLAYLQLGKKESAREWLRKVVDEKEVPSIKLDNIAKQSRAAAAQALQ